MERAVVLNLSTICSCCTALIKLLFNERFKHLVKSGVILRNVQKHSFSPSYHHYVFCMDKQSAGYFSPQQKNKEANRLLPGNVFAGKRRMSLDSEIN